MQSLTQLSLYNNFITELPEEFCRIPKLQMAYLSNNRISKLPDNWDQAAQLRGLFIDGNPIGELPKSFFSIPKLEELTLYRLPSELAELMLSQCTAHDLCAVACAFVSYGGALNQEYRISMVNNRFRADLEQRRRARLGEREDAAPPQHPLPSSARWLQM